MSKSLRSKGKVNEKQRKMEGNQAKMMSAEKCWNTSTGNKNPADKRRLKKELIPEGHLSVCDKSSFNHTHDKSTPLKSSPQLMGANQLKLREIHKTEPALVTRWWDGRTHRPHVDVVFVAVCGLTVVCPVFAEQPC